MPRGKAKKPRRKWGELEQCFQCPREHPGWKRTQLRLRRGQPLCPDHKKAYDENKAPPWPRCPKCKGDEWGLMRWNGSIEKAVAYCDDCDFEAPALDHFDKYTVKIIASPIEENPLERNPLDLKPGESVFIPTEEPLT